MIPKFKVWSKQHQKMFWVWEIKHADDGVTLVSAVTYLKGGETIYFTMKNLENEKLGDDLILLQSTGLKDKNGKEIFEGDVVKRISLIPGGSDLIGVVKMLEGCWVIEDGKRAVSLWTEVDENIVLSNIYENPELVEAIK